jgi:hypothetical protein
LAGLSAAAAFCLLPHDVLLLARHLQLHLHLWDLLHLLLLLDLPALAHPLLLAHARLLVLPLLLLMRPVLQQLLPGCQHCALAS